jgi:integration host factor subunit beta
MTRADLTEEVCQAIDIPRKESDVVVCAIFDGIVRALRAGDKVEIRGFGSFQTRQRQARIGRNPKTGARVEVPQKRIPFFKPSKELRELVDSLNVRPERGDRIPHLPRNLDPTMSSELCTSGRHNRLISARWIAVARQGSQDCARLFCSMNPGSASVL